MCQTLIGKVRESGEGNITIEYRGRTVRLRSKLAGLKIGDYVIFSSGIALDTIDEEEAVMVLGGQV